MKTLERAFRLSSPARHLAVACGLIGVGVLPLATAQETIPSVRLNVTRSNDLPVVTVSGPTNVECVIETSTNLSDWMPWRTNRLPSAGWRLVDVEAGHDRRKFYRTAILIGESCLTEQCFAARHNPPVADADGHCPTYGPPDLPANRDASIPQPNTPVKTVRLMFHILANDDGSLPASSLAVVDAQMREVNLHFAPWRIQFVYQTRVVNDRRFRTVLNRIQDFEMMQTWSIDPTTQHNVFVTDAAYRFNGVGTFPWDDRALTMTGGTIVAAHAFGPGNSTLTHELGHVLGLWHTHHGVSEVGSCTPCYERADGLNADRTGDFCADTPATPKGDSRVCGPIGGTDACSGQPWPGAGFHNFMGYAPQNCRTEFTAQQAGRMHAWIAHKLTGWLQGPPSAPSDIAVTAVSSTAITLRWRDNSTDGTGFLIERSTDGTAYVLVASVGPNITSVTDSGLAPLSGYFYRVRAIRNGAMSDYSPSVFSQTAPRRYWHVDRGYSGSASDGSTGRPFRTVLEGLRSAHDGDSVRIRRGAYAESLVVTGKRVRLESYDGAAVIGTP